MNEEPDRPVERVLTTDEFKQAKRDKACLLCGHPVTPSHVQVYGARRKRVAGVVCGQHRLRDVLLRSQDRLLLQVSYAD